MSLYDDALKFCDRNRCPESVGFVLFKQSGIPGETPIPFAWAEQLPTVFQPFRVLAFNLAANECYRSLGLGGKQRWA